MAIKIFKWDGNDIRVKQTEQDSAGNKIDTYYQKKLDGSNKLSTDFISGLSLVATSGDYDDLSNKPQINNVTLSGNKSLSDLGIQEKLIGSGTGQNIKTINGESILGPVKP